MSILDRITNRNRSVVPRNAAFRITEQGREKVMDYTGTPQHRVLYALDANGSCDIDEMSRYSKLGRGQVERLVPQLVRNGYIQYAGNAPAGA